MENSRNRNLPMLRPASPWQQIRLGTTTLVQRAWHNITTPRATSLTALLVAACCLAYVTHLLKPQMTTTAASVVTITPNVGAGDEVLEPPSKVEFTSESTTAYVERYYKLAQQEQQKFGIPASISLAQGLVESRAGTSKLAVNNNNHFGMKCFSRHCKKGHCTNFTDDSHKDFFRRYQSPWESWREHSELLSKGKYKKLHKYGNNYKAWAYGLQSCGYATDHRYAETLIARIEALNLQRYDH